MDTLVQKAWELYQHTAGFPVETILTATVWLEEKHHKNVRRQDRYGDRAPLSDSRAAPQRRHGIGNRARLLRPRRPLAIDGP